VTKAEFQTEIACLRAEIKDAKFTIFQWVIGAIGFQTVVIVSAVIAVAKIH